MSIWMCCCSRCLRPPCGDVGDGALEHLQEALLHALPETSRVMLTLWLVLPILSISSM